MNSNANTGIKIYLLIFFAVRDMRSAINQISPNITFLSRDKQQLLVIISENLGLKGSDKFRLEDDRNRKAFCVANVYNFRMESNMMNHQMIPPPPMSATFVSIVNRNTSYVDPSILESSSRSPLGEGQKFDFTPNKFNDSSQYQLFDNSNNLVMNTSTYHHLRDEVAYCPTTQNGHQTFETPFQPYDIVHSTYQQPQQLLQPLPLLSSSEDNLYPQNYYNYQAEDLLGSSTRTYLLPPPPSPQQTSNFTFSSAYYTDDNDYQSPTPIDSRSRSRSRSPPAHSDRTPFRDSYPNPPPHNHNRTRHHYNRNNNYNNNNNSNHYEHKYDDQHHYRHRNYSYRRNNRPSRLAEPSDKHVTVRSNTIWIGNLPSFAQKDNFTEIFEKFGSITSIVLLQDKHCAFVCMSDRAQAVAAMNKLGSDFNNNNNYESNQLQKRFGGSIKLAWAPGKGLKTFDKYQNYWRYDTGVAYVPHAVVRQCDPELISLRDGSTIVRESLPDDLKLSPSSPSLSPAQRVSSPQPLPQSSPHSVSVDFNENHSFSRINIEDAEKQEFEQQ